MGRRKKRDEAPLSLFSFQDIMACLTGILILVALLLAIDGLSDDMQATPGKSGTPEESKAAESADDLRERLAILPAGVIQFANPTLQQLQVDRQGIQWVA